MIKYISNLFKSERQQKIDSLLERNNCVTFCSNCNEVLEKSSEFTDYEGVYKETCKYCDTVSYFDYCHPAPLYVSPDDFKRHSRLGRFGPMMRR